MCTAASSQQISQSLGSVSESRPPPPMNDFLFAEVSVPKPPEIENGYVEHLIRYQCKPLYRLRTEGDGKTWTSVPAPSSALAFL